MWKWLTSTRTPHDLLFNVGTPEVTSSGWVKRLGNVRLKKLYSVKYDATSALGNLQKSEFSSSCIFPHMFPCILCV